MAVFSIWGLLIALRGQQGSGARAIGFIYGLTAFALSLSWLFKVFGTMAIILWIVLAAFPALFAEMQSRVASRGISGWKLIAFTALNWGAWEFIRAELFPLKFPWMTAGLAMGPNVLLPWIGVYGVSLLVVLAAAILASPKWTFSTIPLGILAACIAFNFRCPVPVADDPSSVKVAGLQWENVTLDTYLNEAGKLPTDVQHVVWPEYSVPFDIRENKRDWDLVQALCRDRGIGLTFGTQARPGGGDRWRNIALTMDDSGVLGEHTKVHTVHFFDDGTPGTTAMPVRTRSGKIGTPICFDGDYEGVIRKMTAAGAEWFAVPTMDAETWTAKQHDQHAELSQIRAAENGRWILVCATSGVSQVIDARGHVHSQLAAQAQGVISSTIKRESKLTFYTKIGWITPWIVLAVAGIAWGWLFFGSLVNARSKK